MEIKNPMRADCNDILVSSRQKSLCRTTEKDVHADPSRLEAEIKIGEAQ